MDIIKEINDAIDDRFSEKSSLEDIIYTALVDNSPLLNYRGSQEEASKIFDELAKEIVNAIKSNYKGNF